MNIVLTPVLLTAEPGTMTGRLKGTDVYELSRLRGRHVVKPKRQSAVLATELPVLDNTSGLDGLPCRDSFLRVMLTIEWARRSAKKLPGSESTPNPGSPPRLRKPHSQDDVVPPRRHGGNMHSGARDGSLTFVPQELRGVNHGNVISHKKWQAPKLLRNKHLRSFCGAVI